MSCTRLNGDFRAESAGPLHGADMGNATSTDFGAHGDAAVASSDASTTTPSSDLAIAADLAQACVGADPGEPANDSCGGATSMGSLYEAGVAIGTGRIATLGDLDLFTVTLNENLHVCADDGDALAFKARVTLTSPEGAALSMRGAIDPSSCSTDFSDWASQTLCFTFGNDCSDVESELLTVEVGSATNATSCMPYTVTVDFCGTGQPCTGC
jgi:hypothetical protein